MSGEMIAIVAVGVTLALKMSVGSRAGGQSARVWDKEFNQ